MLLQSTDTAVLESSFLDELSKIAEEQGEQAHPWITKERLKRLAVVAPIVALGTGAGVMAGRAVRHLFPAHQVADLVARKGLSKYLPYATGALGGLSAVALAKKFSKTRAFIEGGDRKGKSK